MRKPVFITGEEAAAMIANNATVATIGMTLVSPKPFSKPLNSAF